ncbi:MAG: hypothetical protein Q9204_003362, partial [Flavoplaca sp. TL-2023a]
MSTILPILSEDDCDTFILKLFDACKINADKTPGFGQLQAFRDLTLLLARSTAFKDKVYHYQIWLGRLRSLDTEETSFGIPDAENLAQN